MKRRVALLLLVVFALGGVRFALFSAERRAARASNVLRKELALLRELSAPRVPHVSAPLDAWSADRLAGRFASSDVGALLEATRAARGGLPDGLRFATAGADQWADVARVEGAVVARIDGLSSCLDVLALGRDLALGGGLQGLAAAHHLTAAALVPCATRLDAASVDEKLAVAAALQTMLDSAPSLPTAFREADLDRQLRTFGRWMRAEDLDALPLPARALAASARELPSGFVARQRLLGVWVGLTKKTREAAAALELPTGPRELRLAELEAALETEPARAVGLTAGWREGLRLHEERLALLRLLKLAARLDAARAGASAWGTPGELEAADVDVAVVGLVAVAEGTDPAPIRVQPSPPSPQPGEARERERALRLTLRGTRFAVTLHSDGPR